MTDDQQARNVRLRAAAARVFDVLDGPDGAKGLDQMIVLAVAAGVLIGSYPASVRNSLLQCFQNTMTETSKAIDGNSAPEPAIECGKPNPKSPWAP